MHRFLRAIGFSEINTRKQMRELVKLVTDEPTDSRVVTTNNERVVAEFRKDFGQNIGLCVCGEYNENDEFEMDFSYPYLMSYTVSSKEHSAIVQHADKLSFAGVCEDNKVGISIIYYLQNRMDYIKSNVLGLNDMDNAVLILSALSDDGTIMMPIQKSYVEKKKSKNSNKKRNDLIGAARKGSESALEDLTLNDLDIYSSISAKLKDNDVYSLVDTSFMPFGVECDQYSILGEIVNLMETTNTYTNEKVYHMQILCNEILFDLCINEKDLYGEPMVGRRFKGVIWLQGFLYNELS